MQVFAVAMGEPKHIKRYCGKLAPGLTCLADADGTRAYDAYGLQQGGLRELASLDVLRAGAWAFRGGHIGGKVIGDARMLPGTFIVDTSGHVTYTYYSDHAGDHPDFGKLVE